MALRPTALAISASSVGHTKSRATISASGFISRTIADTRPASSAESQFRIAPSPSLAASFNMPGRRAATRIGTGSGGSAAKRKPFTEKVS